jgi:hypothetical protein
MIKPQIPNIPGVGMVSDTLDFVKNLWGSMNVPGLSIPGMVAPTLSLEELDKKIADLKAVESWLSLNMSMLRGTIQALEVQRGTIATLKSMSASLSAAVKQQPSSADKPASEKSLLESIPYASAFLFPSSGANPSLASSAAASAAAAAAAKSAASAANEAALLRAARDALLAANLGVPSDADKKGDVDEKSSPAFDSASQLINPLVWWNVLQDQFKQAVTTAIASDAVAKIGAAGTAIATDAVVALGAAAVKTNLAQTDKPLKNPAEHARRPTAAKPTAPAIKAKSSATKPKTAIAKPKTAAVRRKPADA